MGMLQIARIVTFCFVLWTFNVSAKEIKIFEEPKSAEVYEGTNIELKCIFSEPVARCFWNKNEITTNVGGRYAYTKGTEYNTKDCSISISNCSLIYDNRMWQCGEINGLMSQPVKLTVVPKEHAFIMEPSDLTVNLRNDVRLDCVLRISVKKCHWKRNGQDVWIDKRYQYLVGHGKNTSICSIIITDVRPIDNGTWQCVILKDDNEKIPNIFSREATFIVKPASFIRQPMNTIVKGGEHLVLDCMLSVPVPECFWKRNGTKISVEGRYRYLTGNGTDASVCSIMINDARITDNGTWQCAFKGNYTFPGEGVSQEATLEVTMGNFSKSVHHEYVSDKSSSIIMVLVFATCFGSLLTLICQYLYRRWINRKLNKVDENVSLESEKSPLLSKERINEFNFQFDKQRDVSLINNPDVYRVTSNGKLPQVQLFWIIDNFHLKTRQAFERNDNFDSDHFYTICSTGCRVKFRIHIDTLHSCIYLDKRSISLCFKFMPNDAGIISSHVNDHEISFIVRDLKTGDMAISQTKQPAFGRFRREKWMKDWTGNRMFSTLALIEADCNYLDKDNLNVEISIRDLNPLLDDAASYDGILNWKINDFSLKRKQEEDGYFDKLVSPQFYTSKRGYLMRASLFLNGSYKHGTHIEIKLRTYRGKYDSELPRAFAHVRNVSILPSNDTYNPIVQTTTIDPSVIGENEAEFEMGRPSKAFLVLRSDVENDVYLQNDTLNIRIEISPLRSLRRSVNFDDDNTVKYRNIAARKIEY